MSDITLSEMRVPPEVMPFMDRHGKMATKAITDLSATMPKFRRKAQCARRPCSDSIGLRCGAGAPGLQNQTRPCS
jgi:hypothetical protein